MSSDDERSSVDELKQFNEMLRKRIESLEQRIKALKESTQSKLKRLQVDEGGNQEDGN